MLKPLILYAIMLSFTDGDIGPQGPQGPPGAQGVPGLPGKDGTNPLVSGAVYIQWGRSSCPATAEMVYNG